MIDERQPPSLVWRVLRHVPVVVAFVGVLAFIGWSTLAFWRKTNIERKHGEVFARLAPGVTRSDALSIVGRAPDCVVRIRGAQALCWVTDRVRNGCPSEVSSIKHVPRCGYASIEVLVGADGLVTVVAFDGEAMAKSLYASVRAERIADVPEEHVQ